MLACALRIAITSWLVLPSTKELAKNFRALHVRDRSWFMIMSRP